MMFFLFDEDSNSLIGLLSWEQLYVFDAHSEYTYSVDWVKVQDEDGIRVIMDYTEWTTMQENASVKKRLP